MPAALITFFTSGGAKWLAILILITGLSIFAYNKHRSVVELEKQNALQEYNVTQLKQTIKDKELFIQQMEDISNHKSKIVAELYIERDKLEHKLDKVFSIIDKDVAAGHDRPSSKVLKDAFKALGEIE